MNHVSLSSKKKAGNTRADVEGSLRGGKNAGIQLPRGETVKAELPVAGIFRLGVNRSGIKGRVKKGGGGVESEGKGERRGEEWEGKEAGGLRGLAREVAELG